MPLMIKKVTGELEEFDREKFRRSLLRPGASPELAEKILADVEKNIKKFATTEDIYRYALERLLKENHVIANRYSLKKALLEFGPTGFPFEKFVAAMFAELGYETKIDQILMGWCVDHEVDIILKKNNEYSIVEAKFHNEQYYRTHVQVTLYTEARFHDVKKTWKPAHKDETLTHSWVVTNTRFTYEALKYGNCIGQKLISWDYPEDDNLAHLIDRLHLYPVTVLACLNKRQKKMLIDEGFVLCRDVNKFDKELFKRIGLRGKQVDEFIRECQATCKP